MTARAYKGLDRRRIYSIPTDDVEEIKESVVRIKTSTKAVIAILTALIGFYISGLVYIFKQVHNNSLAITKAVAEMGTDLKNIKESINEIKNRMLNR